VIAATHSLGVESTKVLQCQLGFFLRHVAAQRRRTSWGLVVYAGMLADVREA
jgi:hypothetical protein